MKLRHLLLPLALLTGPLQAHRVWILPSSTVLSGQNNWVTFDLCASNNIFFFDHNAVPAETVKVTAPDGSNVEVQNSAKGKMRSTFDIELKAEGTYRVESAPSRFSAVYTEDGESKRWRGPKEDLVKEGLHKKDGIKLRESLPSILTYVTLGKPGQEAIMPKGERLEFQFVDQHPNDMVAGAATKIVVLMNGKPAPNVEVTAVREGERYRDNPGEIIVTSNESGEIEITFPEAGRYWVEAAAEGETQELEGIPVATNYSVALTLEVLPE